VTLLQRENELERERGRERERERAVRMERTERWEALFRALFRYGFWITFQLPGYASEANCYCRRSVLMLSYTFIYFTDQRGEIFHQ
jgi:hypothetical protein